jgi:oligopeptide/dipeptide ABC transporter ATP-binding protein
VRDLQTSFVVEGQSIPAVDGVSLDIPRARTVALVGETGCGKSVAALSVMRLIPEPPGNIVGGKVLFRAGPDSDPIDLLLLPERKMREIRGNRIAMIFQEPLVSLNPVYTVGEQIVEAIELHQPLRGRAASAAAVEQLRRVGIPAPAERARDYPHQLSGGMRQRAMIAMALACEPALLIADEPTTALDVTIQRQILDLLRALQAETAMSVLIITHDLGVVAELADYVYVMYAGRIVEHATVGDLFAAPLHPYTQGLLRCLPRLSDRKERLDVIPGSVPSPGRLPAGCAFHPRCELTRARASGGDRQVVTLPSPDAGPVLKRCVGACEEEPSGVPALQEVTPGHFAACWEVRG